MNAENGQNFVNKSEFQCPSADGASPMNLSLHGIVSDFHDISLPNNAESHSSSGHNDLFTDRCSMCHCARSEDSDQELSGELSKVKDTPFHGLHWLCPTCERVVEEECKRSRLKVRCSHSVRYDSYDETSNGPCCPCINCQSDRESTLHQKKEFHKIWAGVAEAIGRVFSAECATSVLSKPEFMVLKSHVTKLCQMNCHYLFKKLEKRCRQMIINMKVHVLKRVTLKKTDTPETAYNFMSIIHRKYHHLCKACDILADVLSPLVEQHMRQFNATWQLHNKYLFCCVIFNEPIVQKCLPDAAEIIRQDLRKNQQEKVSKEQESLLKKYTKVLLEQEKFTKEMSDVCLFWKSCQQDIEKYDETYEIEKMKERKHCLIDGLEFIKKQRQLLKEIQGGCLSMDAFDNIKRVESFEKLWILGRADETHCPNCKDVKCSYDEAGMSHLITCGIISPDIISEEGLSSSFEKHEPDFQEYLNSASIRSTSSSSDDSFLGDGHIHKERRRGDGEVSSEDDEEDDDDDEDEEDDDDDDDDFQDAQQIHLPDFCPSVENASSEVKNRCSQSFLLPPRGVGPNCNCINCNKSLCLLSYPKGLKLTFKANQNGDEEDDDDDEDYDIHEEGIHTSSDLEYAVASPLASTDLLLKTSHFLDYPNDTSFSPKSIIENFMDFGSNQPSFSQKHVVENDFNQHFLLPMLEQQCVQERTKRSRFRTNERQLPPPSSPTSCKLAEADAIYSLEDQVSSSLSLGHHCISKTQTSPNVTRSPAKHENKISKSPAGSQKAANDVGCEIKLQRNDATADSCDKKSGKDRSTQHPEKISPPGVNDKKTSASACNYYQVTLKPPNSCQKQQPQQQQAKSASQQKPGSGDGSSLQSIPQQQKQASFTVPQQPVKQQPFQCRAPSCNGHMVGAGDGGMDKEECEGSPHPRLPSCESDDKSLGGQKDLNGKSHCECWHCEFFGHETQSNAPTSKNFAECRDRLRQKLKKKQSSTKMTSKSSATLGHSASESKSLSPDQNSYLKSVEELIDFINGGKQNAESIAKERRKEMSSKKKSGKNKKGKENGSKPAALEMPSNNMAVDKKTSNCPQHRHTSNSPSSNSMQLDTKTDVKSKISETDLRLHPNVSGSTTPASSSQSSLENSVPMLKINSSKKYDVSSTNKETYERRSELLDKDKMKRDPQRVQQDKAAFSPKTNAEFKTNSGSAKIQDLSSKMSSTPPSSPHCKSKKVDRKTSEDKQRAGIQKGEATRPDSKEVQENGSRSFSGSQKQTRQNISSVFLNGTLPELASKSNGNCPNLKTSEASVGSSSPPGSTKNKKQKKRNKMCLDLSFEEIFKPNDEEDLGEDDREIEEFKRFCFNTPPLPAREKLRVNLNVKDIFNRRKPPQSCNS